MELVNNVYVFVSFPRKDKQQAEGGGEDGGSEEVITNAREDDLQVTMETDMMLM